MSPEQELDKLLQESGVQIKFGLRAQGHIPTIHRMLSEGKSWEDIGRVIHWDPKTAERWFKRFSEPPSQEE